MRFHEGEEQPEEQSEAPQSSPEAPDLAAAEPVSPAALCREPENADGPSTPSEGLARASGVVAMSAYETDTPPLAKERLRSTVEQAFSTWRDFVDITYEDGEKVETIQLGRTTSDGREANVVVRKTDTATELHLTSDDSNAPVQGMEKQGISYRSAETEEVTYRDTKTADTGVASGLEITVAETLVASTRPIRVYASDIVRPTPDSPFERPITDEQEAYIEAGRAAKDLTELVHKSLVKKGMDRAESATAEQVVLERQTPEGTLERTVCIVGRSRPLASGLIVPHMRITVDERESAAAHAAMAYEQALAGGSSTSTVQYLPAYREKHWRIAEADHVLTQRTVQYYVHDGLLQKSAQARYATPHPTYGYQVIAYENETTELATSADVRRLRNFLYQPDSRP